MFHLFELNQTRSGNKILLVDYLHVLIQEFYWKKHVIYYAYVSNACIMWYVYTSLVKYKTFKN